jgi:hypothetical protein
VPLERRNRRPVALSVGDDIFFAHDPRIASRRRGQLGGALARHANAAR